MKNEISRKTEERRSVNKLPDDFQRLSHDILNCANRGEPKIEFARDITRLIIDFAGCDAVHILHRDGDFLSCSALDKNQSDTILQSLIPCTLTASPEQGSVPALSTLDRISLDIFHKNIEPISQYITSYGSFWTGDADKPLIWRQTRSDNSDIDHPILSQAYLSVIIIPVMVVGEIVGFLRLLDWERHKFSESDIILYESVAQALGVAIVNQRAQAALRERVKELTCLYGIATLSETPQISEREILQGIVNLLPPAWQYPDITCSRIIIGAQAFYSANFKESDQKQLAKVIIRGNQRGSIEVFYTMNKPAIDEGPFLKEERKLIDTVASQLAFILERKQADDDRLRLQDQLRHADRLATIGQLAAGVAHELNEPLGGILGFAQLVQKSPEMPPQIREDIERIINSALHAREVVKKLMIFSRQLPTRKSLVDLNKMVKEGLYFLEARCMKAGVDLSRNLEPDLPPIKADQSQLYQVLVNLSVNAVQAMPNGGRLIIKTKSGDGSISLIVEDTGIGMSQEILAKLFIPFFTTKDINEGTGLGLSVVHGIVTAHGGEIRVESEPDMGSKFEIILPVNENLESGIDD